MSLRVVILFNAPTLAKDHADYDSEAGVLESVETIFSALRSAGHEVIRLAAGNSVRALVSQLEQARPDVVANLCESFAGHSAGEPHVAGVLELLGLPYTGSPPECLAIAHNKAQTKRLLLGSGIATPEFVEIRRGDAVPDSPVQSWLDAGPLIVKPAAEDASLGIGPDSVVRDWSALVRQVAKVHQSYGDALAEQFIAGREFNVGIVELPQLQTLPIAEIEFHPSPDLPWPILTYEGKWSSNSSQCLATPVRCPVELDLELKTQIEQAALAAYRITGCRDYARVDLRVDGQGHVFLLEVNANPDAGPDAGLARMLLTAGIEYADFACRLVETAWTRRKAEGGRGKAECSADRPSRNPPARRN